jgi:serine protease inhibitor
MRLIRPTVVLLSTAIATTAAPGQTADREALVRGNTQFALDLYAKLCAENQGNVFFAPQCISTALAMTYAGARTETAEQMAETTRPRSRSPTGSGDRRASLFSRHTSTRSALITRAASRPLTSRALPKARV